MTEPLLWGLSLIVIERLDHWLALPAARTGRQAGWALVGLVLTRYEGWLIAGAALALASFVRPDRRRAVARLAAYPAVAVLAFLCLGRVTVGAWLLDTSFFVPDNPARHDALAVLDQIRMAFRDLAGPVIAVGGLAGAAVAVWPAQSSRRWLPLALAAGAVLPAGAFWAGHPLRVRYMVTLIPAAGALLGVALAAVPRRLRPVAAVAVLAAAVATEHPWKTDAPMIREAQWESPYREARGTVTAYLTAHFDGQPILISMGALAHYMQTLSGAGFDIRNFIHEGNADLWDAALVSPRRMAGWILIEEEAEGGGPLAQRARADPGWLSGFTPVSGGGGVVLYRRLSALGASSER